MARIPYFDTTQATERAARIYAKLPPLNVFRMLGHAGDLISGFVNLGNHLLAKSVLDPILREIAIVRVGVLSGAKYEVQQHENISRKLGMSNRLIAAIHQGPEATEFNDQQRMVVTFTDDVVLYVRASDATFDPIRANFSLGEIEELLITIGYYMMVSRFLETLDVDLETDERHAGLNLPGMDLVGRVGIEPTTKGL